MTRPLIIERAYEIAAEGRYRSEEAIIGCLNREGYLDVEDHIYSVGVMKELRRLAKAAKKAGLPR